MSRHSSTVSLEAQTVRHTSFKLGGTTNPPGETGLLVRQARCRSCGGEARVRRNPASRVQEELRVGFTVTQVEETSADPNHLSLTVSVTVDGSCEGAEVARDTTFEQTLAPRGRDRTTIKRRKSAEAE